MSEGVQLNVSDARGTFILPLGVLRLVVFLPTHLALRKIFVEPPPAAGLNLPIRFL
jgi:hypothetical protein